MEITATLSPIPCVRGTNRLSPRGAEARSLAWKTPSRFVTRLPRRPSAQRNTTKTRTTGETIMAGEQKPPQKLPYVHGPNGTYRERSTKGMELTFAYLQTSGVHGNITGDSNNEGLYITFRSTTRAGFSFKINLAEL